MNQSINLLKAYNKITLRIVAITLILTLILSTGITTIYASERTLEICSEIGMLQGEGDGVTVEYGEQEATRFQAAIMLLRLKGYEDEAIMYTGGNQFTDVLRELSWQPGRNMLSFIKDHPEVGFDGYPDGTFNPKGIINGQMYYKLLLESLGYAYDIDYTWNEVKEKANSLGLHALDDKQLSNLNVDDISEATVEALTLKLKGKIDTLGQSLDIDLSILNEEETNTNTNQGSLTYDFSKFTNVAATEQLYVKTAATDLIRGPYRMPLADDDFYDNFWEGKSEGFHNIAYKAFLAQKGYFNGEINDQNEYTVDHRYNASTYGADPFMEAYVSYQFDHYNDRSISFEHLSYRAGILMADEQSLMFDDEITEKFTLNTRTFIYDVDPAVAPMTVDMLEWMFQRSSGLSTNASTEYVIYADTARNTYYVTKGKEIVSVELITLNGSNIIGNGSFLGTNVQSLNGLSSSIKDKATIQGFTSSINYTIGSIDSPDNSEMLASNPQLSKHL